MTYNVENATAAVSAALAGAVAIEGHKKAQGGRMDALLEEMQVAEQAGVNVHAFWELVYDAEGWAYKVFDPDENKMVAVEGDKAPAKVQTYKSQSIKGFKIDKSLLPFAAWSDLKEAIKPQKDEYDQRVANAFELIKEALKDEKGKGLAAMLESLESLANG